jgi:hypothetical protein
MLSDRALICSSALHDFEIKDSIGSPSDVWGNLYTQGFRIVVTDSNTHKDLPTITAGSLKKDVNFEIRSLKYSSNLTVHTIIDKNNLKTRQRNKC